MPKAKKLPSGSWRCRVMAGGKRRSITVDDPSPAGRRRCEQLAAQMAAEYRVEAEKDHDTVSAALANYISSRDGIASATTLRSYRVLADTAFTELDALPVSQIGDSDVQEWVKTYSEGRTPKTVRNAYSLLCSAVGRKFDVVLPERRPIDYYAPTDKDIQTLLKLTKGTDLERAILLAAFGTLREGEICALTVQDFTKNSVTVSKSMAFDGKDNIIKSPKTASSVRTVTLPAKIVNRILKGKTDRIVDMDPKALYHQFRKTIKASELPYFRFHDLRAYSASVRHALGVPDQYIMADGGWKTDHILKTVYRRAMEDQRKKFSKVSGDHFKALIK